MPSTFIVSALISVGSDSERPSAGLLAELLVGLVGGAARHVGRDARLDPAAAGELATAFIMAAIGHLDPAVLDAVDAAATPSRARGRR
jgi:hypothetical protein